MFTLVPDENSMEDPLCNSTLGSMVTLDYVTPLTLQVREVLVEELRFGHKAIQDPKLEVPPRHRDPLGLVERGVVVIRQSVCLDVVLARPPRDAQLHLLNPKLVRELDQHQAQRILGGGELVWSKPVGAIVSGSRQGHRTASSAAARYTEDDEAKATSRAAPKPRWP